jgi:hypothetical protein
MNPQYNEAAGMQLPPPVVEQAPLSAGEAQPNPAELGQPGVAEQASGPQFAGATMPTAIPLPIVPATPVTQPVSGASSTTQSMAASATDDTDLIEKEWVVKAKEIVERTADDPYRQSEELTAVKADYMKQRYNKIIKLK